MKNNSFPSNLDNNSKTSLPISSDWLYTYFKNNYKIIENIDQPVTEWFIAKILSIYEKAKDDNIRFLLKIKIDHTFGVIKATRDIEKYSKVIEWNKKQSAAIALLHDIARFYQALEGTFVEKKEIKEHGIEGGKIISQSDLNFTSYNLNKAEIINAIILHSKPKTRSNNIYVKLIKDADKLSLLRETTNSNMNKVRHKLFKKGSISPKVLTTFMKQKLILNKDMVTNADSIMRSLAWIFDINLKGTKKIIFKECLLESILAELDQITGEENKNIHQVIEKWKQTINK